jgi:hypothetical protein
MSKYCLLMRILWSVTDSGRSRPGQRFGAYRNLHGTLGRAVFDGVAEQFLEQQPFRRTILAAGRKWRKVEP